MRRSTLHLALLSFVTLAAGTASARLVAAQAVEDGTRGPRFLLASSSRTVPIDVGRTPVLRQRIALDLAGVPLKEALATIAGQAGLELVYTEDVVPPGSRVHLRAAEITVAAALTDVLVDANVDVVLTPDGRAILKRRVGAAPKQGSISGIVTDHTSGRALAGAEVSIQGTAMRVQTDERGVFRFDGVPEGAYTIIAKRIGYEPGSAAAVRVRSGETAEVEIALQPTPFTLSQMVVTASKTPVEMGDVPAAVEVVTSRAIEKSGAVDPTEALQRITGVSDGGSGKTFQSVQLRGMPLGGFENLFNLILIDGVPQTVSTASSRLAALPIEFIDRIEVIKGPNSALYGRNAIGGVINIITKNPGAKQEFRSQVEVGSFYTVRARASVSGPTGEGGTSGYLLSWAGDRTDGFYRPLVKRENTSIFGKYALGLGEQTNVSVSANYATSGGGLPGVIPVVDGELLSELDPAFFNHRTNLQMPTAGYDQNEVRLSAKVEHDLGTKVKIKNTLGYRYTRFDFRDDGDFPDPPVPGSSIVTLFPINLLQVEDHYFGEFQVLANVGTDNFVHHLTAGTSFERDDGGLRGDQIYTDSATFGIPVDYRNPRYPSRYEVFSSPFGGNHYAANFFGVYLQDEVELFGRWRLSIGARYDAFELSNTPPGDARSEKTFTKVSPKIGLTYRLLRGEQMGAPEVNLYAQYSRAFRPPATPGSLRGIANPGLLPENIRNVEFGVKAMLLEGRLGLQAAAFDMTRDGIPVAVRVPQPPFIELNNGGEQLFSGIEIGVDLRPVEVVSVFANYAYYNGRHGVFRFVDGGQDVDLTGNRVAQSPRHLINLGLSIDYPSGFGTSLEGHYEGRRFADERNRTSLDPYVLMNGRVSWGWQNYELAFAARNLLNQQFESGGNTRFGTYVFAGEPRRITFSVGVKF